MAVLTVMGRGAETGLLDSSLEQAKEKNDKSINPKIPIKRN
jgi:hypothetical protein